MFQVGIGKEIFDIHSILAGIGFANDKQQRFDLIRAFILDKYPGKMVLACKLALGKQQNGFDFLPSFLMDKKIVEKQQAWEHYLNFGAYPAVSDADMNDEERYDWLRGYVNLFGT